MTWREPSPLAKGMAASVSLFVFVGLVVQAQWGCDSAGPEPAAAEVPAERRGPVEAPPEPAAAASAVTPNAAPSAPAPDAVEPANEPERPPAAEPTAKAKAEPVDHRRGLEDRGHSGRNRRYLSSTKSDPDMFGSVGVLGLGSRSAANEPPEEPETP